MNLPVPDNQTLADVLTETAQLLELVGENPFKIKAYRQAADALEAAPMPVAEVLVAGTGADVPGIGASIRSMLLEYIRTGSLTRLEELKGEVPPGILDLLQLRGLGPKKIQQLWREHQITSVSRLLEACQNGTLAQIKGFGNKTVQALETSIQDWLKHQAHYRIDVLTLVCEQLEEALASYCSVYRMGAVALAENIGTSVEVLITRPLNADVCARLQLPLEITMESEAEISGYWLLNSRNKVKTSLYYVSEDKAVSAQLSSILPPAYADKWSDVLQEHWATPSDFYARLGLPPVPTELWGWPDAPELCTALHQKQAVLVGVSDIQGVVHAHSTYSDGVHTLEEMAIAARDAGFSYLLSTDHSRTAAYAGGLSIQRVREQWQEIDRLNDALAPFRILKGIESDILPDGSLDYPSDVLAGFDAVVASIHSGFAMTEAQATERMIRAIRNPYTHIVGHVTGRLLLKRSGYPIDVLRVLEACAETGTAIEINANPYRLDLDWHYVRTAVELGIQLVIAPDAHSIPDYGYIRWGVQAGRKGLLTVNHTLNARPVEDFLAFCRAKTASALP
jgi:DNA polymerase (family 10)